MSRCGSTLIAQMLAALERAAVISEAPAIDDAIQAGRQEREISLTERAGWLRSIVSALVRRRHGEDLALVKLDAWHVHSLPLVRAAFPETPWLFLYRDPVEVLTSQLRRPGKLCLPRAIDPAILGLEPKDVALPRVEWCARTLAGVCRAALSRRDDPKGMFLNYSRLPEAAWGALADHFSVSFTSGDVARMRDAARFDAKDPSRPFQRHDDLEDDREDARAIGDLATRFLAPLFAELERS